MSLQKRIKEDMMSSMKNKDSERLSFIRFLIGQFNQVGKELTDDQVTKILKATAKNSKLMGNQFEVSIIESYLPKQLTEDQIRLKVSDIITENEFNSMKDMGKVMGMIKDPTIDGKIASKIVKELLSNG